MPPGDLTDLASALEDRFGLDRAIIRAGRGARPRKPPATSAPPWGRFPVRPDRQRHDRGGGGGVGWGRTLDAALMAFRAATGWRGVRVVSLLGGVVEPKGLNPIDFAWRLAGALGGDCLFVPGPR